MFQFGRVVYFIRLILKIDNNAFGIFIVDSTVNNMLIMWSVGRQLLSQNRQSSVGGRLLAEKTNTSAAAAVFSILNLMKIISYQYEGKLLITRI